MSATKPKTYTLKNKKTGKVIKLKQREVVKFPANPRRIG